MEFTLTYEGRLQGQNSKAEHKWEIRKTFDPKLRELWNQEPLLGLRSKLGDNLIIERSNHYFLPLITRELKTFAEINVLLLKSSPKTINTIDSDNQLKTLLDALRIPGKSQEINNQISTSKENPFYCLLEDDALVTKVGIEREQLLGAEDKESVLAIIKVNIKKTETIINNMIF